MNPKNFNCNQSTQEVNDLKKYYSSNNVGLVHGQMSQEEKNDSCQSLKIIK